MLRFAGSGASEVGLVRVHNEDAGYVGRTLAVVADGVGGAAAGEVASATAVHALVASWRASLTAAPAGGGGVGCLEDRVVAAADAARAAVRLAVQRDLNRLGMATTVTLLACDGERVVLGHMGDSRAYRWRGGTLEQVSTDHTYLEQLRRTPRVSAAVLATHPWRKVVLRALDGDPADSGLDVLAVEVRAGDRLVLCTDGVSDLLDDATLAGLLDGEAADVVSAVVEAALAAGGRDNITCAVLDVVEVPDELRPPAGPGLLLGAVRDGTNVVSAGAAS
ncbi:PP2C family serine/threonine-protein phosphatase [Nocardioides sp. zg-DK7169]|uniref:PP2C family protein-serine/threonine phosphatase n=1 Tax=Nocardioides sp. zg-DK7169 TaxID=2736600 RepID=UPI00155428A4|nr:protein phosphatase 2C domain-containing protein [Nocardioides sp. zg-DK7169]NPC96522.1 serine/threonine-protein phosphatase [Nocardioides sp. zg-DK7169]